MLAIFQPEAETTARGAHGSLAFGQTHCSICGHRQLTIEGLVFTQPNIAMSERELEILRDGLVLGSLPESDARELLRLGFFRPDDLFRRTPGDQARPLSELTDAQGPAEMKEEPSSWFDRARQSVTDATSRIVASAGDAAGRLKSFATENTPSVSQATNKLLEGYLPQIRQAAQSVTSSKAVQSVRAGVHDDDLMRKTFGAVYDCLPRPVCRFVNEERFITFCLERRKSLLGLNDPDEKRQDGSSPDSSETEPLGGS